MKRIITVLFVMFLCASAFGAEYPELGVCIGDNVRLREDPGTDGKIIGRADTGTRFVILGEVYVDGQKWYEIDHPFKKGNAYIIAKHAQYGWYYERSTGEAFVNVRLTFGIYQEKARALFGKGTKDEFGNLVYPAFTLRYDDETTPTIQQVQINKRGYALAGVQVGDNIKKLLRLGMPEDIIKDIEDIQNTEPDDDEPVDGPEGWTYENKETREEIFFQFGFDDDNKETIVDMILWTAPHAEG